MKLSWFSQRIVVLALLAGWLDAATAETYVVDGRTNVIGSDLLAKGVPTTVPEAGEYTFELTASDFRENVGAPMSRHVVACSDSTAGDFRCFTLNEVGDAVTMNVIHAPLLFFVDTLATDNTGSSTVELRNSGGALLETYVVDGQTNVIGSDLLANGVQTAVPAPDEYTFELTASDFRENVGAPMSRHVVACSDSTAGDFRCFTLNEVGDVFTMHVIHAPLLFFVDTLATDNTGSSTVELYLAAEPEDCEPEEIAKLFASDGAGGDEFGVLVAMCDENTAVIGAYLDDENGTYSGSAYVFQLVESGWMQVAKLLPSDGAAQDRFGLGVGCAGSTAVAGAYGHDANGAESGAAYVFLEPPGGWGSVQGQRA